MTKGETCNNEQVVYCSCDNDSRDGRRISRILEFVIAAGIRFSLDGQTVVSGAALVVVDRFATER
jgi:hypothetical protein